MQRAAYSEAAVNSSTSQSNWSMETFQFKITSDLWTHQQSVHWQWHINQKPNAQWLQIVGSELWPSKDLLMCVFVFLKQLDLPSWQVCQNSLHRPYRCVQEEGKMADLWRLSWCRTDYDAELHQTVHLQLSPNTTSYSRMPTYLKNMCKTQQRLHFWSYAYKTFLKSNMFATELWPSLTKYIFSTFSLCTATDDDWSN